MVLGKSLLNCSFGLIALVSFASSSAASSLPTQWHNLNLTEKDISLNKLQSQESGWYAYSTKQVDGQRGPCCFTQNAKANGKSSWVDLIPGCKLGQDSNFYGHNSDAAPSENIVVLTHLNQQKVDELLIIGDSCPLDGNQQNIQWLNTVSAGESIQWLAELAKQNISDNDRHQAVMGISHHAHSSSVPTLKSLAVSLDQETASSAIHGISIVESSQRYEVLNHLLDELPEQDKRHHVVFALANLNSVKASERLMRLVKEDHSQELKHSALFALAESDHINVGEFLQGIILNNSKDDLQHSAVYALAELESPDATQRLWNILNQADSYGLNTATRGSLWYSLIELDPTAAIPKAQQYLLQAEDEGVITMVLAALSDIEEYDGQHPLIAMVKAPYPASVRRHALFHLADSDDPAAIAELFEIIKR